MECKFVVGQKVVCVRLPDSAKVTNRVCPLQIGKVYTIDAIELIPEGTYTGFGLLFTGRDMIVLGLTGLNKDFFEHKYFAPLEERKTDISIFTKLLNTQDEKELV